MTRFFPSFGDRRQRRIGLLGGSFNPAHDGHLHISREAIKRLGLHEVWWLVSPQNPLKSRQGMAALGARVAGARALATDPAIIVGDLESRIGVARTAQVLKVLTRRYPRATFIWLMGADNLEQIPRWWRWTRIFHTARVAVFDRSPYAYRSLAGQAAGRFRARRVAPARLSLSVAPPAWSYVAIRRHPASGTALRETLNIDRPPAIQTKEPAITTDTPALGLDETVAVIRKMLDDSKAQDIVEFDLAGKTSIADRMIIASGTSTRQVTALAENLVTRLKQAGVRVRSEGKKQGDWVLVDVGDVIVHLFRPEVRAFYDIERLWAAQAAKPAPAAAKTKAKPAAKAKSKAPAKTAKRKAAKRR